MFNILIIHIYTFNYGRTLQRSIYSVMRIIENNEQIAYAIQKVNDWFQRKTGAIQLPLDFSVYSYKYVFI